MTVFSPRLSGTWRWPRITPRSWVIAATRNTCPVGMRVPRSSFPSIAAAGSSPAGTGWVTAHSTARRCSRSTGPSAAATGVGASPRTTSAAYPQAAVSRASPSRPATTRRKVRSLGTVYRPRSGLNRAPMRCRTSCGVRAAHCRIAATESFPTTSVAHAVSTRITNSGRRRPRSRRGSGTCRSRSSSDDATDNGKAVTESAATESPASSASHNARSARWSTTGLIGEDDDTSATPETIFWHRHPERSSEWRSPNNSTHRPILNTDRTSQAGTTPGPCAGMDALSSARPDAKRAKAITRRNARMWLLRTPSWSRRYAEGRQDDRDLRVRSLR
ncbi:MAG: hypothetical protein JWR37_5229 [Mycobacterium sp.]|nr:hypothetical protein [Mycobacterium sp.]